MTPDDDAQLLTADTSPRVADRIRQFTYDVMLRPKFAAGASEVEVRAGDVHAALKLRNQMPSVCSALESRKFIEVYELALTRREGPSRGSNAVFFFKRRDALPIKTDTPSKAAPLGFGSVEAPMRTAGTVYWVSCVAKKRRSAAPAKDLYVSDWFAKARAYVECRGAPWWILSANYGLVSPDEVIDPYELTLNTLSVADRKQWARRVQQQFESMRELPKKVVMLAGARYREFIEPYLKVRGIDVEVPMEGLRIGEQLSWLSRGQPSTSRLDDLRHFYLLLERLQHQQGGMRTLSECNGRMPWPRRGVYFFFESGERRSDSGPGLRVVRVGTHALKSGSRTDLWHRLSQHRGSLSSGRGNHRGSIFRLIIGDAIARRDSLVMPRSWGVGRDVSTAALGLDVDPAVLAREEDGLERTVSAYIYRMPFLHVAVDDDPGPGSDRAVIERNAIALLSNFDGDALDAPSLGWLGRYSSRDRVQRSGLWNNRHVDESYDPSFLLLLERHIAASERTPARP